MESRTLTAVLLLALLVSASCQLPPSLYEEETDLQSERQVLATLLSLITPALTNILTLGATNLATALFNMFFGTFVGKTLELIPLESLLATPIRDATPSTLSNPQPHKRRPYTRAMTLDDKPLQSSQPLTTQS